MGPGQCLPRQRQGKCPSTLPCRAGNPFLPDVAHNLPAREGTGRHPCALAGPVSSFSLHEHVNS